MPYNVYYHTDDSDLPASEEAGDQNTLTEEECDFLAECEQKGYFI